MSWSLVVCIEKDGSESEAVVPTNWVRGKWLHFSNSLHAERDKRMQVDIKDSWPTYEVVKVKLTSGEF